MGTEGKFRRQGGGFRQPGDTAAILWAQNPQETGTRSLTQGQHGLVVHPHDLPVQRLLRLRQHLPLLVGEVDGHLVEEGRHLGEGGPCSGAGGGARRPTPLSPWGGGLPPPREEESPVGPQEAEEDPGPGPCVLRAHRPHWLTGRDGSTWRRSPTHTHTPGIGNPPSLQSWTRTHPAPPPAVGPHIPAHSLPRSRPSAGAGFGVSSIHPCPAWTAEVPGFSSAFLSGPHVGPRTHSSR